MHCRFAQSSSTLGIVTEVDRLVNASILATNTSDASQLTAGSQASHLPFPRNVKVDNVSLFVLHDVYGRVETRAGLKGERNYVQKAWNEVEMLKTTGMSKGLSMARVNLDGMFADELVHAGRRRETCFSKIIYGMT